jgi:3-oxoacyl-[acyl-carrier protein] reductase
MTLANKGAVVVGGAGSIGQALVASLRGEGARVAVLDGNPEGQRMFADPGIMYVQADAADDTAAGAGITAAAQWLGEIDVLVNCAGLIHSEPLISMTASPPRRHSVDSWDAVIRKNLTATFLASLHVAEHMATNRIKGVIVNLSSVAASGNPGQTAYSAAKAGVEAMTTVWARELGPLGIRVAAIAPGFVDTASTHAALSESAMKEWKRRTPLGRLATTQEIAKSVLFVIENDFVSGCTIRVDGGLVI